MKKKSNILRSVVAIVISLFHLIPFYILITTALKPMTDLSSRWIFPKEIHLENFTYALEKGGLITAMYNSIIITVISVLIIALIGATIAYPLARIKTKTNSVVLNLVVAVMMIPPLSMLVPLYSLLTKIGAINTYWGIIVITVTMGLPLSIFLYSNFISTIPVDLEEAASIDGCSRFKAFYKVVLPLLKPVTATVVILTGVNVWNDFQFPLYILQVPEMKTLTLAVSSFFSQNSSNLNAAAASALIAIIPVVIIYLLLQKQFVQGMVDSAIK